VNPRKGKKNDQAHPPIHPTAYAANLAGEEKKVYEYITRRFLASCSKDAEGWETTVDVVCGGEEFYATGIIVFLIYRCKHSSDTTKVFTSFIAIIWTSFLTTSGTGSIYPNSLRDKNLYQQFAS